MNGVRRKARAGGRRGRRRKAKRAGGGREGRAARGARGVRHRVPRAGEAAAGRPRLFRGLGECKRGRRAKARTVRQTDAEFRERERENHARYSKPETMKLRRYRVRRKHRDDPEHRRRVKA